MDNNIHREITNNDGFNNFHKKLCIFYFGFDFQFLVEWRFLSLLVAANISALFDPESQVDLGNLPGEFVEHWL